MFPHGFLGTRADALMDVIFVSTLLTPGVLLFAFRLAKQRRLRAHRNLQTALLCVLLTAVVLFETEIRLSGGSGSLMKGSSWAGTGLLRGVLLAHVLANVVTFITWLVLVIRSWRRFEVDLPGAFASAHKRLGLFVFGGTVFGALSAVVMYVLGFVL